MYKFQLKPGSGAGDAESHPQVDSQNGSVDNFDCLLGPAVTSVRLEHQDAQQRNGQQFLFVLAGESIDMMSTRAVTVAEG